MSDAAALEAGYDLAKVLNCDDLVAGEDVFFSATGVTDGDVLQGVRYQGGARGHDRVAGDALAVGHRPARVGAPRPRQATRAHGRALRLTGLRAPPRAAPARGTVDSRPTFERGQVQVTQRAQERVRDQHVDRRLRGLVHRAC